MTHSNNIPDDPLEDKSTVLNAAFAYVAAGRSVAPISPNQKYPQGNAWKVYQDRLPTEDEMRSWFRGAPRLGLCIICGEISGGLEVIDCDLLAIYHALVALVRELGYKDLLERLVIEVTPKPGVHLGYLCETVEGNKKLARQQIGVLPTGKPDIKTLIETRGEGGLIVVAPTPSGIHPDCPERGYELVQGDWTRPPRISPEERQILWNCARALNRYTRHEPHYRDPQDDMSRIGNDYNARVTHDEILTLLNKHDWKKVFRDSAGDYLQRPGKSGRQWSATLGICAPKRFYVFTTNGDPFDNDRSYDPFGVYARLEHAGDFKAATKALAALGYGRNGQPHEDTDEPRHRAEHGDDEEKTTLPPIHLTDWGNAQRLIQQYGQDLRYVEPWRKWLIWRKGWWEPDNLQVEHLAKRVIARMFATASEVIKRLTPRDDEATEEGPTSPSLQARKKALALATQQLKWALTSESTARLKAMVESARSEPGMKITPAALDADPWLLNVENGTINLKTGRLQPHQQKDLLTRIIPVAYDPQAQCPQWLRFLDRIMAGNQDLISYIQRAVGYSLTGSIGEQCLFFLYGTGQNGKSTFLLIILILLGEYAMQAIPELLIVRHNDQHPTERADLFKRRFVSTVEVESGKALAESLVKALTGGERLRVRRMREDFWEFNPTHKIWLAANHKPIIRGTDFAIWRRIRLIPFTVRIPDDQVDKTLAEALLSELPGILTWAVQGCLAWQQQGLKEPPEVKEATDAYRNEMDRIGQFLKDCCLLKPGDEQVKTQSSRLCKAFCKWAGEYMSQTQFSGRLTELGYAKRMGGDGRMYWIGIGLVVEPDEDENPGEYRGL